jgi:asparagine synthase (glutamine-hydrolysing)
MCGICGVIGAPDPEAVTRRMLGLMPHRGPDDEGLWTGPGVALGHRRLSIVDLSSAGHQPMLSADGQTILVANGEIYNFAELRAELEQGGATFRSHSDSEVILHAYRASGTASFSRFNGMIAFGLYDAPNRRLVIARDRLGIKPVYYFIDEATGALYFASEIKAIIGALGRSRWMIDPAALRQYLTYENLLGDTSLFAGVKLLPPGSFLIADVAGIRIETYWTPQVGGPGSVTDFSEATRLFTSTFDASIRRHLMSDVPVASYLSAGLDSTMVASRAAALNGAPLAGYTGSFPENGWYDEVTGARLVAEKIGAAFTAVPISGADLERHLDDVIYALDEPRMGIGAFSQYMVAKRAAEDRKVILTGHGGDELFSGYPVFKLAALMSSGPMKGRLAALSRMRAAETPHLAYFLLRRLFGRGGSAFLPQLFSPADIRSALSRDAAAAVHDGAGQDQPPGVEPEAAPGADLYTQVILTYLRSYLPGLLVVEDKISMAHSLEARTPFLDNEMVDLGLRTAPEVKLHDGQLKAIVRAAARGVLPDALFSMPKRGFPTPLAAWLRGPSRAWAENRLLGPESRLTTVFNEDFLRRHVHGYMTSPRRRIRPLDEIQTHRMWMLLSLESWLRQTQDRLGVTLEM